MTATFALPFLTLPDEAVTVARWAVGKAGGPLQPARPTFEDWDYAVDVELRGSLSVDIAAAASLLAIPREELKLAVVLTTGTGRGRFPRAMERACTLPLDASTVQPLVLSASRSGNSLSGRLHARVEIVLSSPPSNGSVLSPSRVGSRLWSEEFSIDLEDGGENRFPIELVSFEEVFREHAHVHAPWYLSWRPGGLEADFRGSIRLYVNSDHADLAKRVVDEDSIVLQAIFADVMVQMVGATLEAEDIDEQLESCDEGSVGAQIVGWLELAFPGRKLSEVQDIRRNQPGHFHAALHAAAQLGDAE